MRKLLPALLLSLLFLLSVVLFVSAQEPPLPPKGSEPTPGAAVDSTPAVPLDSAAVNPLNSDLLRKIEPQLLKKLLITGDDTVPFIVYLRAQADLSAAVSAAIGAQAVPDPLARRQAIVNALQRTAQSSQRNVVQILSNPPALGGQSGSAASGVRPLWIVNAVAARGGLDTILAVASQPEVAVVRLDDTIKIDRSVFDRLPAEVGAAHIPAQQNYEWGISKIRADLVHQALAIDGQGVVVANIDTGVDWLHPALQSHYRGYQGPGKQPRHAGNWFDATGQGATYPVDSDGHGTHTMGTAVGQNGIGVAPGAAWIAVRAFVDNSALNSWLHTAFQWALAPNDDPALAPHIVNNSWGSDNGFLTEFQPDVQALLDAGILPVFSAGNNGPSPGTVGSPASLDNAFSVGATDINDDIAIFSSRGPSPWEKIKPEISAPGKDVRSALPGGAYGLLSGTSMAAPHVSGLAALLLQASPALSGNLSGLTQAITTTAIPLGSSTPNNVHGWGRIDAYNAVMSVISAGVLQGTIVDAADSSGIAGALVSITPSLSGATVTTNSDASGSYALGLTPGTYNVSASAFGYDPAAVKLVNVTQGVTTSQNFSLTPKPAGTLAGTVTDRQSGLPIPATITILGTPVSTNTLSGSYQLGLPVGVYTVTISASRHRIARVSGVNITANSTTILDAALDRAPSILLVDSGRWYQESEIEFYQQALEDALYTYDLWQITHPFDTPSDVPTAEALAPYDVVIWSAPFDSPGYVGADEALTDYLDNGGKLFVSGQDVAYFDGGGALFGGAAYFWNYLKARYVQDNAGVDTVTGTASGPLAGLSLTISGGDGADNQQFPDVVASGDPDFADPLLYYGDAPERLAGLYVGRCLPYRAVYLAFGLEGVNQRVDRQQVLERSLDWLLQSPPPVGIELSPAVEQKVGGIGKTVSHTMRLRNTGLTTDQISLALNSLGPYNWATEPLSPTVALGPCTSEFLTVTVQIPATAVRHVTDTLTVQARSGNAPSLTETITRHTKTPAPVLLVDDDRWYSFAAEYQTALASNNVAFDYWRVPKSWSGPVPPSPPLDTLRMYPMTVWYTAYDWFQPLTLTEEERLVQYLDEGGRLFFSSQDFLYYHLLNSSDYLTLPHVYLGVQAHTEDFSSTVTIGRPGNPVGAYLGPYPLSFPPGYRNWTDALTPTTAARVATLGQVGQPNGLTHAGRGAGGRRWHTNFLSYGLELLPAAGQAKLMQRAIGWLSWLGDSTVTAEAVSVSSGALISYTATISNDGWEPIATAYFTATFPAYLTPQQASPNLAAAGGEYLWNGALAPNEQRTFTYTAQINQALPVGTVISQSSWLAYPEHTVLFDRIAAVKAAPDLSGSELRVSPALDIEENDMLTYTLVLRNQGLTAAATVTTTNALPEALNLVTIDPQSQGVIASDLKHLTWTTTVAQDEVVTLTYRTSISGQRSGTLRNIVTVDDGVNPVVQLSAEATFKTLPIYMPIIFKSGK